MTAPTDTPRLLLSAREAAAALNVSERTLWSLTRAGDVPHVRLRSRVLYRLCSLADYAAAQEQRGGP